MKKKEAMRLVKALRSGKFVQGNGYLEADGKHCCLGVACVIGKAERRENDRSELSYVLFDDHMTALPPSMMEKFGFADAGGARRDGKPIVIGRKKFDALWEANDSGVPFHKIADYIEKHYEAF